MVAFFNAKEEGFAEWKKNKKSLVMPEHQRENKTKTADYSLEGDGSFWLLKGDFSNNNSKYFEILDKEIKRKVSGDYNLGIYLTKYQKKEHKQYIHMVVYEVGGYGKESRNIILEEKIEMKFWIYT